MNDTAQENKTSNKAISVCFTGHRSQKLPWKFNENNLRCIVAKVKLKKLIIEALHNGYKRFFCGMALGFDLMCAEILLNIKEKHPNKYSDIELIAAIPCKNQDCKWHTKDKIRYRKLLNRMDKVRCKYEYYNGAECMLERNRYMVNNSSLMIALFDGQAGGTKSTIEYARKNGLEIKIITP